VDNVPQKNQPVVWCGGIGGRNIETSYMLSSSSSQGLSSAARGLYSTLDSDWMKKALSNNTVS